MFNLDRFLKSPEKVVFSLALLFGLMSAILVPQMAVNDESAHFLKTYAVSTGKLAGRTCTFPEDIVERSQQVSSDGFSNDYSSPVNYSETTKTSCGSVAGYSPIMHMPQTIGVSIGKLVNGSPSTLVLLGRIASVVFYSFALYWIVRLAKHRKWAYVVIGLFPLMIHTAGSLSGDTINNLAVMASMAYIFNLFSQSKQLSRKQIAILVGISLLLTLSKTTSAVFLILLVVLPARLFKHDILPKSSFNIRKWLVIGLCGIVTIMTALLAQKIFGSALFRDIPVENPLINDPLRFFPILYNTYLNSTLGYNDLLLRGVVGEFASFKYHTPSFIVVAEFILLFIALFYKRTNEPKIKREELGQLVIMCCVAILLFTLLVTLALYSAWAILPNRLGNGATYADGVQGRYFTAALVLTIPIAMWLRKYLRITIGSESYIGRIVFGVSLASLLFYTAQTYAAFN